MDVLVPAVDLAISGVRIEAPVGVGAGDVLSLTLDPESRSCEATGVILDIRPSGGHREAHVVFTAMGERCRADLGRLIARCVGEEIRDLLDDDG